MTDARSNEQLFFEISSLGQTVLAHHVGYLPIKRHLKIIEDSKRLVVLLDTLMVHRSYNNLPQEFIFLWDKIIAANDDIKDRWGSIFLAYMLSDLSHRNQIKNLPNSVVLEIYHQCQRISNSIMANDIHYQSLSNDIFLKDMGICGLYVFPCKAQIVDSYSGIPRSFVFSNDLKQFIKLIVLAAINHGKFSPYYQLHLHEPLISNLNEPNLTYCFLLVADLLRCNPSCLGLIGISWFYDPEIKRITPHLAYLQDIPAAGGALFFRIGQLPQDIQNATKFSNRRQLYEKGEYVPTSYMMIWPRKKLLSWATQVRSNNVTTV
ncbi:MAG: hypothetical protein WC627_12145 [Legionella sp.]|jgi:hypothetical protein